MELTFSLDGINFQTDPQFENLSEGDYNLIIIDSDQCTNIVSFTIVQYGIPIIADIETVPANCGKINGSLLISVEGGISPYQYSIDDGSTYQSTDLFINLDAGVYSIYIKDENDCITQATSTLDRYTKPMITNIETTIDYCNHAKGSINVQATGFGELNYKLADQEYTSNGLFVDLESDKYSVSIIDSFGCIVDTTATVRSSQPPTITNLETYNSECNEASGSLTFDIIGGEGELLFFLNDNAIILPSGSSSLASSNYKLTVVDSLGCEDEELFSIEKKGCTVFIPNVFSPNDDQHNDYFNIIPQNGFEGLVISFYIYDRWGNRVYSKGNYSTQNPGKGWDGTFNKQPVTSGVYSYVANVKSNDGSTVSLAGTVTLVR